MIDTHSTSPNQAHKNIRDYASHNGHYLTAQGPINTFVHHNTLHAFQEFPFYEAVEKAQSITGGRGYLPNTDYRKMFHNGRISEDDISVQIKRLMERLQSPTTLSLGNAEISVAMILRHHLVYGIDPITPEHLSYKVNSLGAMNSIRSDVPSDVRDRIVSKTRIFLSHSVKKIGVDWTVSDWFNSHTNINITSHLIERVVHAADGQSLVGASNVSNESLMLNIGIVEPLMAGYLSCISNHLVSSNINNDMDLDVACSIWLQNEAKILSKLMPLHLGIGLPVSDIVRQLDSDINTMEAYANKMLWLACLECYDVLDPFSPTDPGTLSEYDPDYVIVDAVHEITALVHASSEAEIPFLIDSKLYDHIVLLLDTCEKEYSEKPFGNLIAQFRNNLGERHITSDGYKILNEMLLLDPDNQPLSDLKWQLDSNDIKAKSASYVHTVAMKEVDKIGRNVTHGEFLSTITGDDIDGDINRYMIQILGGFLDEGLAAWHTPNRDRGLYNSWRLLAKYDKSLDFYHIEDWRKKVASLPDKPEQAIENALNQLGIKPESWDFIICQLLQKLPGWSGMIAWREENPDSPRNAVQPADLVQMLAIRMTLEAWISQYCCMENWGVKADIASIKDYFSHNASELYVRRLLERGELSESLAQNTHELIDSDSKKGVNKSECWERIAQIIWFYKNSKTNQLSSELVHDDVWCLYNLSQCLGLSCVDIRNLNRNNCDELLSVIKSFPDKDHGWIWLNAYEGNYRDKFLNALSSNYGKGRWSVRETTPQAQVVFCIDEREEAIRRHLEEINPSIETFGAAGFFGLPMRYKALDDHGQTPLCPVAIVPDREINEVPVSDDAIIDTAFLEGKVTANNGDVLSKTQKTVDNFKSQGADAMAKAHDFRHKWSEYIHSLYWEVKRNLVSSYFLLDLLGLPIIIRLYMSIFAPNKMEKFDTKVHDWFVPRSITKLSLDTVDDDSADSKVGFALQQQVDIVFNFLTTIGLTRQFSKIVVLCGHGSSSVNNPHESAHDCGACGGKHGGPNARAFADLANRPIIRQHLAERGMTIPDDTWFIGSQHNTCHEGMDYFDVENVPSCHHNVLSDLISNLDSARARSAQERCRRFDSAPKDVSPTESLYHIEGRALDVSQVRPEWGHATNAVAVVGRRSLTQGLFLDRRPFLISYNPTEDASGDVLERILLAVGPVGAGINLEYYFSTVDNKRYGCDTKIPHNVSGLIGVMEGVMSDLRTGLPMQMVEVHEPMRLQLVVEAKADILGKIYGRQPLVQTLLNNEWLHLIVADPDTGKFVIFDGGKRTFVDWDKTVKPIEVKNNSWECYRGRTNFVDPCAVMQPVM
jgi:uncharacterized protein YbcC (UPF0753/DUF2309 family)